MPRFVMHFPGDLQNALTLVAFSVFQGWYEAGTFKMNDSDLFPMAVRTPPTRPSSSVALSAAPFIAA